MQIQDSMQNPEYFQLRATAFPEPPEAESPTLTQVEIPGKELTNKAEFMAFSAQRLEFPAHFGHNWDAFYDSLGDYLWQSEAELVAFVFQDADQMFSAEPDALVGLLDVLKMMANYAADENMPAKTRFLFHLPPGNDSHLVKLMQDKGIVFRWLD